MKKRKKIAMLVVVSVPADMTAAQARREVRTLVKCNYSASTEDVRVRRCGPASADRRRA